MSDSAVCFPIALQALLGILLADRTISRSCTHCKAQIPDPDTD